MDYFGGYTMATFKFEKEQQLHTTPLSNIFIDDYMPIANPTFVKVYIYALRLCYGKNTSISNKQVATAIGILETDVVNAWLYWKSVGVVKLTKTKNSDDFDVAFIDLKKVTCANKEKPNRIMLESKPQYTAEEIALYIEQNESVRYMYKYYEQKAGKPLSSADINILYSLYDWLRMPIEIIIMLLEYCHSLGKMNMRYIEKLAIDWVDKGITNIDMAEKHLKSLEKKNAHIYNVRKVLGILERALTDMESTYIESWTLKMNHGIEMIKMAFELTVTHTGKLSFAYMNSILESWHKQGLKTMQQVTADIQKHKQTNKDKYQSSTPKPRVTNKNTKFVNFTQRKYDYKELERLAKQKSINNLKEGRSTHGL